MTSDAKLARTENIDRVGKVAQRIALTAERVRSLEVREAAAVCCGLWNSANIAIPSGVWTPLTFNTENYDVFGMHSIAANTSRITATIPGKYLVTAGATWAANVAHASGAGIRLYLNGATIFKEFYSYNIDIRSMDISGAVYMSSDTDYVEVYVMQNTGAPVNVSTLSLYSPALAVHKYG
jgi:hypothetical protein